MLFRSALGVTDVPLFTEAYGAMFRQAHVVMSPDARQAQDGETAVDVAHRAIQAMRTLLDRRADRIAAVIVEPLVQCAVGMAMHDPQYLRLLRALCDEFDVHLIADEIAVGCGRSGSFFACEQARIWPDFLCLSKGISGGYLPLSLVMTRDDIYQAFYHPDVTRGFLHSHSYTGNPLACRAALATLEIFAQDDVIANNHQRAQWLADALAPIAEHSAVRHARQRGMIVAFDVMPAVREGFARRCFAAALEQELLLRPIGTTVYWMPPYVLDEEAIKGLGEKTRWVVEAMV